MSECIYKFVERPKPESPKKQRYRSKYDPKEPLIGSTFGLHGTTATEGKGFHALKEDHVVSSSFGIKQDAPDPKRFLRKGSRECRNGASIPSVEHHNRSKEVQKPPVPMRDEKPIQGLKTSKNFIHCNAVEAIHSMPKKRGEEEIPFTKREEYGKVPAYLDSVKAAVANEKQIVDMYVKEQFGPLPEHKEGEIMDERERIDLINKLKQKWDDVNALYQKNCHKVTLDTPGEIKRKAAQEAELKQLEGYIEKLSRPGPILIKK